VVVLLFLRFIIGRFLFLTILLMRLLIRFSRQLFLFFCLFQQIQHFCQSVIPAILVLFSTQLVHFPSQQSYVAKRNAQQCDHHRNQRRDIVGSIVVAADWSKAAAAGLMV
jgi:hypothetical protein